MRRSYISIVFRLQQAAVKCKFIIFLLFFLIYLRILYEILHSFSFFPFLFSCLKKLCNKFIFTKKNRVKEFYVCMDVCIHNSVIDNIWNYIQFPWTYLPFQDYVQTKNLYVLDKIALVKNENQFWLPSSWLTKNDW